jgi:hypothetical protein
MTFQMAALIRLTLLGLYLALVAPLPFLAPAALRWPLWLALALGLVLMVALTSEQVELDAAGLRVGHPRWCRWLLRRGWTLAWPEIRGLTPVATSQGGRVYYVRSSTQAAYLLPQRVAHFETFLQQFSQASGLDTSAIGRISPPWTYQLLAVLTGLLLAGELAMGWWARQTGLLN